ncbi:TPA: hypothetical protein HA361_02210 [Candidatus Woesearchaeota archaeon]|nr:hypothetical protein [Candidatus Woesearchaeota archaeon]HII69393.1 hypothetical protein [Candidatus Woesearchaeota archaeon]
MIGKRGLSPLVATIILVVFSLLIGTIVMSLGGKYTAVNEDAGASASTGSAMVISTDDFLGDPLKELQIKYITGKISREEYLEKEQEILQS